MKKYNYNHPTYYNKEGKKECIDEMRDHFTLLAVLIFCWLTKYKYDYRKGLKQDGDTDATNDCNKASWYEDYYFEHFHELNWWQKFIITKILHLPNGE